MKQVPEVSMTMQRGQSGQSLPERREEFLSRETIETLLWQPRFIGDPGSMLHVPLLFWIAGALRPSRLAVLGADDGVAFFALCQALDKLNIAGRCHGIGFWPEDGAGAQGIIRDHARQLYTDLADLQVAGDPAAALDAIRNGSLDLLLVDLRRLPKDGCLDILTLKQKLGQDGVLILLGAREAGFPLMDQGERLEFQVGAGLVLLPRGDALPQRLLTLTGPAPEGVVTGKADLFFRRLGQGLEAVARQSQGAAGAEADRKALAAARKNQTEAEKALTEMRHAYQMRSRRLGELQAEAFSLRHEADDLHEKMAALNWQLEESRSEQKILRERAEAERSTRFQETAALTRHLEQQAEKPAKEPPALTSLHQKIEGLQAENKRLSDYTTELLGSTSWRITAPMRKLKDLFRG